MTYLIREDGERFVIPSYRDIVVAKQKSQLKADILLLSQSYGEYITLQRKTPTQYEVAFSTDRGYLLGETVWHYFKRPDDMVYCEAIPNTSEAILVIVKAGSVYLDGRFPLEGISEELVIFLTQKNNFDIYLYGDVPISKEKEVGKFSFDAASVKSFNLLTQAVFANLPLLKIYELQLVDSVLKAQGIGVFPVKPLIIGVGLIVVIWGIYSYFVTQQQEVAITPILATNADPYDEYKKLLASPSPTEEINDIVDKLALLMTMPGWRVTIIKFINENLTATVVTPGGKIQNLLNWAQQNKASVAIKQEGIEVTFPSSLAKRKPLLVIYPIQQVISTVVDRLTTVYPGNNLSLTITDKTNFTDAKMTITLNNVSFTVLSSIADQFRDLPIVLNSITLDMVNGIINGSIIFDALGSPT